MNKKVCIGIPCYQNVSFEILDDYMRFAYYLGRRCTSYDFALAIKGKTEQFRARNAIVKSALQWGCDYILMLDDDHILDVDKGNPVWEYSPRFGFIETLLKHLESDPQKGIVGGLYVQRGREAFPVIMKEFESGPSFMLHEEITGTLQQVDITGGGCMLIRKEVFEKISDPWFGPEFEFGTDIQICRKVREAGFSVWCDTSIHIGHVMLEREILIPTIGVPRVGLPEETGEFLAGYKADVLEYTGKTHGELLEAASTYKKNHVPPEDLSKLEDYYKNIGEDQLARNFCFHMQPEVVHFATEVMRMFTPDQIAYGLDYYCGSAPIGFELAQRGHNLDFVDVDGAYGYEFVKWRVEKYKVRAEFEMNGPYDYILLFDAIEHMNPNNCEEELGGLVEVLRDGGAIMTNYLQNGDYDSPEHINMDKTRVKKILVKLGVHPITSQFWVKSDLRGKRHGKTGSIPQND